MSNFHLIAFYFPPNVPLVSSNIFNNIKRRPSLCGLNRKHLVRNVELFKDVPFVYNLKLTSLISNQQLPSPFGYVQKPLYSPTSKSELAVKVVSSPVENNVQFPVDF
jgi:hypothetical protein